VSEGAKGRRRKASEDPAAAAPAAKKRAQGRPATEVVGRDAVLAAARKQIQELPPARVTISSIAREAGVDPALVRYYFGNREKLLLAVIDEMTMEPPAENPATIDPIDALVERIRSGLRFTRSAKNMHRLMIDELAHSASPEIRARQAELNQAAVAAYARIMARDGGERLKQVDPLFLFIAIVGVFDFFVSGQPVIGNLVPEGTDPDEFERKFEAFVIDMMLNGLRKR